MEEELEVAEATDENNDSLNVEEWSDTDEVEDDDTTTVAYYEKLKQQNKELYKRAKKAEALAKAKKEAINKPKENQSSLSREEAILYAKGYTDDEVSLANKISKLEGVSPLVAIEDDLFKAKVEARKKKEKSEQAALPASGGVGKYKTEKPVGEMTREEHEAYYKRVIGLN